ncbi:MAG: hypothetical protein ABSG87_06050 [Verrucomicrobiota bacterium]|jgi:hypothetical protein
MTVPSIELLRKAILDSTKMLKSNDGILFSAPIEEHSEYAGYDARKLHEVCINHKLAEHLATNILPLLDKSQRMFVDIEFNREGINYKMVTIEGQEEKVRPDIIIHNRKSNEDKFNLLVVECKKDDATDEFIQQDIKKIKALMKDSRYEYHFGFQVSYGAASVKGKIFYKQNGSIVEEPIVT